MTAGGGRTDGQARSRAPLTCVLPASLLPLPTLEPLSFPAPSSYPPKCPLAAHHCRCLSGQRHPPPTPPRDWILGAHPHSLPLTQGLWLAAPGALATLFPAFHTRGEGQVPAVCCSLHFALSPSPWLGLVTVAGGRAFAAWPPWAAWHGQVLLSTGQSRAPLPGFHVTCLVYPFGRDCGPASPLGAGEPRGHRAAPPGIRFSSGSKTFLRHMVPWPPSPGTENTVLGSRLGLTLSVWGEALEGDVENPAAPGVSDYLLRSQAAGGVCPVGGDLSSFFAVFCFSGSAPSEMQLALPLKARAQSRWWSPVHTHPPRPRRRG